MAFVHAIVSILPRINYSSSRSKIYCEYSCSMITGIVIIYGHLLVEQCHVRFQLVSQIATYCRQVSDRCWTRLCVEDG